MGISVVKETAQYGVSERVSRPEGMWMKRFIEDPHSEKQKPEPRNNNNKGVVKQTMDHFA